MSILSTSSLTSINADFEKNKHSHLFALAFTEQVSYWDTDWQIAKKNLKQQSCLHIYWRKKYYHYENNSAINEN